MSISLPMTAAQRWHDRQHINEQVTACYQEQANKLGLDLVYSPGSRRVDVYRRATPLCTLMTVGELRMFLLGYETAVNLMKKEIMQIIARLEARAIEPVGERR